MPQVMDRDELDLSARTSLLTAMSRFAFFAVMLLALAAAAQAQTVADTLFAWEGYGRTSMCRLAVYPSPEDEDRPYTVVVREVENNEGDSTLDDARYLVEQVGRTFDIDPTAATWVFHWGAFSYEGAQGGKELLLQATFRRGKSGTLTSPSWRLVSRAEVEEITDRQFL